MGKYPEQSEDPRRGREREREAGLKLTQSRTQTHPMWDLDSGAMRS